MISSISLLIAILAYHSAALAALIVWKTTLRALPIFLGVMAIHMSANLLENAGYDVLRLTGAMGGLYGPLVYVFVREAAFADRALKSTDAIFALPFIALLLLPVDGWLRPVVTLSATLISLGFTFHTVLLFRRDARQARAIPTLARMDWLMWATVGFLLIASFDIIRLGLEMANFYLVPTDVAFAFTLTGLLVLTAWLARGAVEHARRGGPLEASEQQLTAIPSPMAPSADHNAHFAIIKTVVDEGALHLEHGLRLAELADAAALTPREASEAINACYGDNFSAFINARRALHARRLIERRGRETLLDIALASGFSSKTAFNTFFKREVGETPSEYTDRITRS